MIIAANYMTPIICTKIKRMMEWKFICTTRCGINEVLLKFSWSLYSAIQFNFAWDTKHYKYLLVSTTWTLWNAWSTCNQICDTGTKYRDRQCPGSNPLGTINKPGKTPQYGGERDCSGDTREQPNCNTHSCSRKLNLIDVLFQFLQMYTKWYLYTYIHIFKFNFQQL